MSSSFFGGRADDDNPTKNTKSKSSIEDKPSIKSKPHRICKVDQCVNIENLHDNISNPPPSNGEDLSCVTIKEYDPSKESYHPILDACWSKDEDVPFMALCKTFNLIEATSSRLKMISILTNYFHSVLRLSQSNLVPSIYLCLNQIGPSYEGKELGVGDSMIISVLSECSGKKSKEIKKLLSTYTDLGILAENCKNNQMTMVKHKDLTISHVFSQLKEIGATSGSSSATHKKNKIRGLLTASKKIEVRYLVRSLQKKLRIGLAEQSIIVSIAHAYTRFKFPLKSEPPKEDLNISALAVKTAFCELPCYDVIIEELIKNGIENLHQTCKMRPGIPVRPMLANSSKSIHEILERFEKDEIACEFKYDGERAQIHCDENGKISIFSRNQEDSTLKFPDVVDLMSNIVKKGASFIIDSEIVAFDLQNSKILPFQQLSTRKRKNVEQSTITIQVCIYAFDLLYYHNLPLVRESYRERRGILHNSFDEIQHKFMFAIYRDVKTSEDIQQALDDAIKSNCEGLIIKTLDNDATYEIAKRSHNWRKLKKDYLDSIGDSFDLVVMGGYFGVGKRSGCYGGYLLGAYNPDLEQYESICKIGTGFTDNDLKVHFQELSKHIINKPNKCYSYPDSLVPDHWFEPNIVWEIRAADISLSPIHQAAYGKIQDAKGFSLRFPRFVRNREDKLPTQATNIYQIIDIYNNQQHNHSLSEVNSDAEEN